MRTPFALIMLFATGAAAQPAVDPALLAAERVFVLALDESTATPAVNLMDAELTWTDANGRTLRKADVAGTMPVRILADETTADVRRFQYGRIAVVQVDRGRDHVLRVWIRRGNAWRLLVYQEVRSLEQPPTVTPGTGAECINPCRQVPYTPKNADERGVIAAFQTLETASHAADASRWGTHVAEEFVIVSSNSDRALSKAQRIEGLKRARMWGVAPTRLLSTELIRGDDDVIVMRAQHEPHIGDRLQITRVWLKRSNVWQSTVSYQTAIRQPR